MKTFLLVIGLLTASTMIYAHEKIVRGTIFDDAGMPLPYAMLGVKGKSIGTISNDAGYFVLRIPLEKYVSTDSIIVSYLGFHNHTIPLANLIDSVNTITASLISKPIELVEVIVMPQSISQKRVGRANGYGAVRTPFFLNREAVDDELGREVGTLLRLPKGMCRLLDANIYIAPNPYASIKLRLLIYDVNNQGLPHEVILNQDILLDYTYKQTGWNRVDLTPYNLILDGDTEIAICYQWIKSELPSDSRTKNIWIGIPCAFPSAGNKVIRRESSQDIWTAIKGVKPSIYLTVENRK